MTAMVELGRSATDSLLLHPPLPSGTFTSEAVALSFQRTILVSRILVALRLTDVSV